MMSYSDFQNDVVLVVDKTIVSRKGAKIANLLRLPLMYMLWPAHLRIGVNSIKKL
jgi:hypothetical protein